MYSCMDILIQIGPGVQMTERVLLVYVSVWGSTMISWASKKQKYVALSTAKALQLVMLVQK
jgi:hypothetical protein